MSPQVICLKDQPGIQNNNQEIFRNNAKCGKPHRVTRKWKQYEKKIIQHNYTIRENEWKIIYNEAFDGKPQPHTHNYKRRGRSHKN